MAVDTFAAAIDTRSAGINTFFAVLFVVHEIARLTVELTFYLSSRAFVSNY